MFKNDFLLQFTKQHVGLKNFFKKNVTQMLFMSSRYFNIALGLLLFAKMYEWKMRRPSKTCVRIYKINLISCFLKTTIYFN